jgi:outer membrane receptor protein involved in Fe transport
VYFIRWSNIQVQETTPDGAFVYQGNAGEARVKGVEFEFTAHPIEYLAATFAGSYQDAFLAQGATAAFNIPLAPYTLVGLRAGVITGPWTATAFVRNLTDKRAQVSAINSDQDPDALLTVQPRTIGLTVTRTF